MNRFTAAIDTPEVAGTARPPRSAVSCVDVHQHLWPPTLVDALRARRRPPRLRGWTLELAGEPPFEVDPREHDVQLRARQNAADGIDLALISLSSPLGIELLGGPEGEELLGAWREGAPALAPSFGAWAAASVVEGDPVALERDLAAGFVGLQMPACALLDESGYRRATPLLEVLERLGRPLFIHPGPAEAATRWRPAWWAAVVDYVAQMHAAWFAWLAHGRERHPQLRVVFAILAGLAPLHGERVAARAQGHIGARIDPNAFVEVSSYGMRAIDATVRVLGIDQLVNGSDRPYAPPVRARLGDAADAAIRRENPIRLLGSEVVKRWI
jgi:predicted TIM-barrel fold metal-dependent hydrolase